MKKICMLMTLQIIACTLFAQKTEAIKAQIPITPDGKHIKQEYLGYTIISTPSIPTAAGTIGYGFNILKDNHLVYHQAQNPLPYAIKGLQTYKDASTIAQWVIREYVKTSLWQQFVPMHVAHELKINTTTN